MSCFRNHVVPVVMGAHPDDYKRVAPPGSFIHVDQFQNPKALAEYLNHLNDNDDKYNNYFRWLQTGDFVDTKFWCRICSLLWDPNLPHQSVPNLDSWWRGKDICIGKHRWDEIGNTTELVEPALPFV